MRWIVLFALAGLLGGCASPSGERSFVFPAERYAEVFDATRVELRRAGYTLERIDATSGEILTAPKTNAGLATPFEPEYASVGQVWQDTINSQPRTIRVRFRDAADGTPPPETGEIRAEVEVVLWRLRRPGWRLETESIRMSRNWLDPSLSARGVGSGNLVPLRRDDAFASRLAARVRDQIPSARVTDERPEG